MKRKIQEKDLKKSTNKERCQRVLEIIKWTIHISKIKRSKEKTQ